MRRLAAAIAALLHTGCGGDDGVTVDAAPPDAAPDALPGAFDCFDLPLPTTASDPVTVTGVTSEATMNGNTPIAGVTVTGYQNGNPTPTDTGSSDADGVYTATIATGGVPLDGYIVGHRPDQPAYRDTYLYPPAPLAIDTDDAPILMVSNTTFSLIQTLASVGQTPGNGWIGVLVTDCYGDPVRGAVVTTTPAYTVKYNAGGLPSPNATRTEADGFAYVFNVIPGDVVIDAAVDGRSFREHTILTRADVITTTAVAPGPVAPPP